GLCSLLVGLKTWLGIDDSLDVAAVHLGGGVIGALCLGLFASRAVNPAGAHGLFYGGGYGQLGLQTLAAFAVAAYSFVVTYAIGAFLDKLLGTRVSPRAEAIGVDLTEHGETAYQWDSELEPSDLGSAAPPEAAASSDGQPYPPVAPRSEGQPYPPVAPHADSQPYPPPAPVRDAQPHAGPSVSQPGTAQPGPPPPPQSTQGPPPPGFAPYQSTGGHPAGDQPAGGPPPAMPEGGWPPGPSMSYGDGTMSR